MAELVDRTDIQILEHLQHDVTISMIDLAERIGSSKSACSRRIQRLIEIGIIRERVAILDPEKLGLGIMVFAHVKMSRHGKGNLPEFVDQIRLHPEVVECHTLMGDVDFLLKIIVRDKEQYEHFFWSELSQIEGVQEVSSSISLTKFVETTRLPLRRCLTS